jgi:putative aldouronate transport system substrate-binding protein
LKRAVWFLPVLLIFVLVSGAFAQGLKEFDVFTGEPLPDYPGSTIIGDIIRAETGVKLNREALVGDLETKVGLMIASGDSLQYGGDSS